MLSFIKSLVHTSLYYTSRQKVMLRRRKRQSKKQKSAKKQLKEHDPKLSLAHQLKILQIQKQLDRKMTVNHHLNELIDDLFYPDIRYANQKQLEKNVLQMTSNLPKKQQLLKLSNIDERNSQLSEQSQQIQQIDELIQQIYLCQLPSQMFQLFNSNFEYFGINHTICLLNRFRSYFKNRQKIKEKLTKKWLESVQKLKQINDQKVKIKKRCPYIFLDKEDLIKDQSWILMVKKLGEKLKQQKDEQNSQQIQQKIQQKQKSQDEIQYLNSVKESYEDVQKNCDLLLCLVQAAGYIPNNIYQNFINKIINLTSGEKNSLNNKLEKQKKSLTFSHNQMVKIILVLTNKYNVKSHFTSYVNIQAPDESKQLQQKVLSLGKKLVKQILNSQKCSAQDLGAVIRSSKGVYKFINHEILQMAKSKIVKYLYSTNLQRTIDYVHCFWRNGTEKDMQFINLLKFDIYRKLSASFSKIHLFNMLKMIKYGQIQFKESGFSISISQIYEKVIETITTYIKKTSLNYQEIQQLVKSLYQNFPVCEKRMIIINNKMSILQMICGQIIRIGDGYSLQDLSDLLFRINVLGYKSNVLAKYVFGRFKSQFKKQIKNYQEQKLALLPNNNEVIERQSKQLPSLKQIQLSQSLIMMIWSIITTIKDKQLQGGSITFFNLNQLLQMWMLKIRTDDPIIWQLIFNINQISKQQKLFPQIKIISDLFHMPFKQISTNFIMISSLPVLPTLKQKKYSLYDKMHQLIEKRNIQQISNEQALKLVPILLNMQAVLSNVFFSSFSLKHRKFIKNQITNFLNKNKAFQIILQKDYFIQKDYINWLQENKQNKQRNNYFNTDIKIENETFLLKRAQISQKAKAYYDNLQKQDKLKNWRQNVSSVPKKYQFV